jgi:hypothetical protein
LEQQQQQPATERPAVYLRRFFVLGCFMGAGEVADAQHTPIHIQGTLKVPWRKEKEKKILTENKPT